MDGLEQMKAATKMMWSLGDYREMGERLAPAAEALAAFCRIAPGMRVLDVAAGTGNFALSAARRGALVTATDLTPLMVEWGRARSAAEGLDVEWREADAEDLPFPEGAFDVVGSTFGAMFAPRPEVVARELFRVARHGGLVAMANWTAVGFAGKFQQLVGRYLPRPPVEMESPQLWGDANEVGRRFAGLASSVDTELGRLRFEFESVEAGRDFMERNNGPQIAMRQMLDEERYHQLLEAGRRLVEELNQADDGRLVMESEYLLVRARR